MTQLRSNAKQVQHRLANLARTVDDNLDQVVQEVIADVGDSITEDPLAAGGTGTPRDTQRATNNWNVSNGLGPDFSDPGPSQYGEPNARAEAYSKIHKGSESANIANGTPYIELLDRGWSRQAPRGFVRRSIKRAIEGIKNIRLLEKNGVKGR